VRLKVVTPDEQQVPHRAFGPIRNDKTKSVQTDHYQQERMFCQRM